MEKICKHCGIKFIPSKFHKHQKYCSKRCNKAARIKRTTDWLQEYKKTLKCQHCGLNDFRVIEFHHIINSKDNIMVCKYNNYSKSRLINEIKKCISLCCNCHRILHWSLRND